MRLFALAEEHKMLRIEKDSGGCVTKLRLSGRIQSDQIAGIRSELGDDCATKILDLSQVTLVDLAAVRFLIRCEDDGIKLAHCPSYVREWTFRERAERAARVCSHSTSETLFPLR
jgi:hypothetical protein